ncbi:iron-sulfur cluster assembly scaffold protein [Denitrobaculum tricleocarpae]|uniref:Iron-sulfur cluster assembly scaffold protein n=1 Tax=Denitrobaculum tricleocarpae TaxID=2591009 RepID=A0A545TY36_9PROT|nr:iron-sulfur cluster assembly scaffold protein [Denitrobaculum tricleocarpae]TQV82136.1 iron-sulfur cluster assembly scaffold protein [Denitrobaculum tricleocarpae]
MSEDLYHKTLIDLAAVPEERLAEADLSITVDNPLCGDRVTIDVQMENGKVAAIGREVRACLICQASAAVLSRTAIGQDADQVAEAAQKVRAMLKSDGRPPDSDWAEMANFQPVADYRSRHGCVLLPFDALKKALAP